MKQNITLAFLFLWAAGVAAQVPTLVKDINPGAANGLRPLSNQGITVLDGILYFAADDGEHGFELWRSDGTEDGTWMVKDIYPGDTGSSPIRFTIMDNQLFFFADDGEHGDELWKSDGTEAGTVMVKDVNPGPGHGIRRNYSAQQQDWLVIDNVLYFAGDSGSANSQLWRSDGSEAGTYFLADVCPQCNTSSFYTGLFANLNGKLYFFAEGNFWESDGTPVGTVKILDIVTSTGPNVPERLTAANGLLYFSGSDNGSFNREPWVSDGTAAGTKKLLEIAPGTTNSSRPRYFTGFNGHVYFVAADVLWRTDGTEAGTEPFGGVQAGSWSAGDYNNFLATDDLLFLVLKDIPSGGNNFMYSTDGTAPVFTKLAQVSGFNFTPNYPLAHGGVVYFTARNPATSDYGIGISDGTVQGTSYVNIGQTDHWEFRHLTLVSGHLYFYFQDPAYGVELWKMPVAAQPLVASIEAVSPVSCFGGTDGALSVSVTGGSAPFTFAWTPDSATGQNPAGLAAGTYTVTVTDADGSTQTGSYDIGQPAELTATVQSTPAVGSQSNGTASVTAGGGTPPYTYQWDDPATSTSSDIGGLLPGAYNVTLTDANGCTLTAPITVELETGTDEAFAANISVVPTLSDGGFSIRTDLSLPALDVRLLDGQGRLVKSWKGIVPGQMLWADNPAPGLYSVQVFAGDRMGVKRVFFR